MNDVNHIIKTTHNTEEIVNSGLSQVFEYGIAMTTLSLFLIASVALNAFLLWFFVKFIKDSQKLVADLYALGNVMSKQFDNVNAQYNQIILFLSKLGKE